MIPFIENIYSYIGSFSLIQYFIPYNPYSREKSKSSDEIVDEFILLPKCKKVKIKKE
jgi:hypothetical protein